MVVVVYHRREEEEEEEEEGLLKALHLALTIVDHHHPHPPPWVSLLGLNRCSGLSMPSLRPCALSVLVVSSPTPPQAIRPLHYQ